jgi:hypothetical protein
VAENYIGLLLGGRLRHKATIAVFVILPLLLVLRESSCEN